MSKEPETLQIPVGAVLHERYKIKKILAIKSIGTIYLADDIKITAKQWVVKECFPLPSTDKERFTKISRFHQEAEKYKELSHPHLAKIIDSFSESNREYLVMEYVEGLTAEAISQMSVNPLDERQVMQWIYETCHGIEFLHSQENPILFRDLCPRYVMLSSEAKIKLVNFGFDRVMHPSSFDLIPGEFVAPEVEEKGFSFASDIYSIGAIAYFLLTKEPPASPLESITKYNPIVNPKASQIIDKCLKPDPQMRFSSAEDLRKEIELYLYPPTTAKVSKPVPAASDKIKKFFASINYNLYLQWKRFILYYGFLINPTFISLILIIFGLFGIYRYYLTTSPRPFIKSTPLAYVLCKKSTLVLVNTSPGKENIVYTALLPATIENMALSESRKQVFLSSHDGKKIFQITTSDTTIKAVANLKLPPGKLILDPRELFMYVTIPSQNLLSILTTSSGTLVSLFPTGQIPGSMEISKDGKEILIANNKSGTVSVINLSKRALSHTLQVGTETSDLKISPDNKFLVVVATKDGRLIVYDLKTKKYLNEIQLGSYGPHALAFSPNGEWLYVSSSKDNKVSLLEAESLDKTGHNSQVAYVDVIEPTAISVTPDGGRLIVCYDKNYVGFFNSANLQLQKSIRLEKLPIQVLSLP